MGGLGSNDGGGLDVNELRLMVVLKQQDGAADIVRELVCFVRNGICHWTLRGIAHRCRTGGMTSLYN